MILSDIAHARLANHRISRTDPGAPADVVSRLGAVQSQDYAGAKWAVGLRLQGVNEVDVDGAFNDGEMLRTHILRPTWHFVAPADIRWLLALTAPRVHTANSSMYRQLELDGETLARGAAVIARALRSARQLTRDQLRAALEQDGITVVGGRDRSGQRLAYMVMWAELEGVIASGPRQGRQFTYMLLDERAPQAQVLARDEALAELTRRYFTSRGPATPNDYAKWSGLTVTDARAGLEAVHAELERDTVDGQTYWFPPSRPPARTAPAADLLSVYDEYFAGYKDRGAIADADDIGRLVEMGNALTHIIVIDGQIAGTWRRTFNKDSLLIELNPFRALSDAEQAAIAAAAERCGEFFGRAVVLA